MQQVHGRFLFFHLTIRAILNKMVHLYQRDRIGWDATAVRWQHGLSGPVFADSD